MLTLQQLYELGKANGIDIYSGISLPTNSPLDRSVLINTIIMRCGLNIPMYADPAVMAAAISVWSAKNQYTFEHVAKIYEASYSPIENYDRYEDISTTTDRKVKDDTTGIGTKKETINNNSTVTTDSDTTDTHTTSHTGSDTNAVTHTGYDTTDVETTTSAYDASTYEPDSKTSTTYTPGATDTTTFTPGSTDTVTGGTTEDTTVTNNGTSSRNTTSNSTTNKDVAESEKVKHTGHLRGNIGVTTATQMETEEYEFIKNYNPYDFISGLFENDLTLYVF